MWYEILPSMGVIVGLLTIPPIVQYYGNKLVFKGNSFSRDYFSHEQLRALYRRDTFNGANVYVRKGLENIPDN